MSYAPIVGLLDGIFIGMDGGLYADEVADNGPDYDGDCNEGQGERGGDV